MHSAWQLAALCAQEDEDEVTADNFTMQPHSCTSGMPPSTSQARLAALCARGDEDDVARSSAHSFTRVSSTTDLTHPAAQVRLTFQVLVILHARHTLHPQNCLDASWGTPRQRLHAVSALPGPERLWWHDLPYCHRCSEQLAEVTCCNSAGGCRS